jgi:RNA 2',3'-cyclic 3'-phosphodiesterase
MPMRRTFVAIELPEGVKKDIENVQKRLSGPGLRMVDPGNLHLTIKFIGDWEEGALADLCAAVGRAAASVPAFGFTLGGVGAFPNASRPHVVYISCSDDPPGSFRALHEAVETELLPLGIRREGRVFKPHLTLARVKEGRDRPDLEDALHRFADYEGGGAEASELAVVLSDLTSGGPIYTRAGTLPLG